MIKTINRIQHITIAYLVLSLIAAAYLLINDNYFVAIFVLFSIIFVPILLSLLIGVLLLFYSIYKTLQNKYYNFIIRRLALKIDKEQVEIQSNIDKLNGAINGNKE